MRIEEGVSEGSRGSLDDGVNGLYILYFLMSQACIGPEKGLCCCLNNTLCRLQFDVC